MRDLHPGDRIRIHLLNAGLFNVHALTSSPLKLRCGIHVVLLLHSLSLGHCLPHLLLRYVLHGGGRALHSERSCTNILNGERGVSADLVGWLVVGTYATHFSAEVKFFFNTSKHGVEILFEGLQQVSMYVGLREVEALVGEVEKEECSFPEELVSPPPNLLLKLVQLITEEVVHKELALKVWQHNPKAKPYLHWGCRYYENDLFDYPKCFQEQDGSDPTGEG